MQPPDICSVLTRPPRNQQIKLYRQFFRLARMGNELGTFQMEGVAFDQDEIKRLGKRFKKLDLDGSGSISIEEFMSLPELQQNPLVRRVIDIFDEDKNGEVGTWSRYADILTVGYLDFIFRFPRIHTGFVSL